MSVGWCLSHTRSEIGLSESDLEIYSIFFPAPWQVTLVIRPGRGGSMRAGFFVREPDGTVKSESSYLEFNFPDRLAGVLDRPPERTSRERGERRTTSSYRTEAIEVAPAAQGGITPVFSQPLAGPQLLPPQPSRRKWPWLVAWALVVLVAAILGLRYWMQMQPQAQEPISLALIERDGQLQIEWNHSAKPILNATGGSIQIVDGADSGTLDLTPRMLATGNYTVQRKSGDVQVTMTVETSGGAKVQEASRFLGRPVAASDKNSADLVEAQRRRDELEAEVARLQRENGQQAAKIQQLQRTLRVLEIRLGIADKQ